MASTRAILVVLAFCLAAPADAQTTSADVPLEIVAYQSDLIVVGQIPGAGQPQVLALVLPNQPKPLRGWFCTFRVEITQVIKDKDRSETKSEASEPSDQQEPTTRPAAGVEITVLARSNPPPGKSRISVSTGGYFRPPRFSPNREYILALRKLLGRGEYYLPASTRHYRPARRTGVAEFQRVANVDAWPWGQASDGLQIAVIPFPRNVRFERQVIVGGSGQGAGRPVRRQGGAHVQFLIALRNVSNEAICVNLYKPDRVLSFRATGPEGKAVPHDFYRYYRPKQAVQFGPKHLASIAPGEVLFVGPDGPAEHAIAVTMPLTVGDWQLQATYASQRQVGEDEEVKPWKGKISSDPGVVQVRKAPDRRW